MKTINTQFAIFNGRKITYLTKATTVAQAIGTYIIRIIRDEYDIKADENGKWLTKENLQAAYDDWANTAIENLENDGHKGNVIINLDDMLDNWSNRAWVVELDQNENAYVGIGNQIQYKLIEERFNKVGIELRSANIQ